MFLIALVFALIIKRPEKEESIVTSRLREDEDWLHEPNAPEHYRMLMEMRQSSSKVPAPPDEKQLEKARKTRQDGVMDLQCLDTCRLYQSDIVIFCYFLSNLISNKAKIYVYFNI